YRGKTVRIIVGASAGGGYDTYSRTIARHMGKHIPGNPGLIVDNMPGAGFLISANYMYKVAKPDGLTIGHFIGGLFLQQLLGKAGVEFDARKFEYIGVPAQDNYMLGVHKSTGITSIEQWLSSKTIIKFGGVGVGSATDDIPKVLGAAIGLPFQLVSGYKGTADVRLAFNSGEINGICNSWESFKATWSKELSAGEVVIVLQNVAKPHPDQPKLPLAINYAKTDEGQKLIRALVHSVGPTARPYVLPPGTPNSRVLELSTCLNMSKMTRRLPSGMPMPVSETSNSKFSLTRADIVTVPRLVNLIALSGDHISYSSHCGVRNADFGIQSAIINP